MSYPCSSPFKSSSRTYERGSRTRPSPSTNDLHRSHSFIVDPCDEGLKVGLRRKSFTGDTLHPILHQLSEEGKVHIPVEHIQEEDAEYHTSTTVYPELPESTNYARNINASSASVVTKKTAPTRNTERLESLSTKEKRLPVENSDLHVRKYDPQIYEDKSLLNSSLFDFKPVTNYEKTKHIMVSGRKDEEFETSSSRNRSTVKSQTEIQIDHEREMKHQDDFMKENYNLHRFLIIPDGNCLYRAIAQACLLDQNQHSVLRQLAVDHITEHKDEFKELIEGDIEVFLSAAQLNGEWAGYPEILALSRVLEININITTGGSLSNPKVQVMLHHFGPPEEDNKQATAGPSRGEAYYTQRESLWLSWLSNGHYDTFTAKPMENPAYDNWLASKQSRIESDAVIANKLYMDDVNKVQQLQHNRVSCEVGGISEDDYMLSNSMNESTRDNSFNNHDAGTDVGILNNSYVPAHVYPSSTQRRTSPKSPRRESRRNEDLSSSQTSQTNLDTELAMALHNEEYDQLCAYLERNRGFDIA